MSDLTPAEDHYFAEPIRQYHELSKSHARTARSYSISIALLIALGLFIVIALPYVLSMADKLFRSAQSADTVEASISDVELRIEQTLLDVPPFLTLPAHTQNANDNPLFYPGLQPLWPATETPAGHWVVSGDNGQLLVSDTRGQNWQTQSTFAMGTLWPPVFTDETHGVITGTQGALLTSDNGGETWSPAEAPLALYLNPPVVSPDGVTVISGARGTLIIRETPQSPWRKLNISVQSDLGMAVFDRNQTGLIPGDAGTLLLSENGGLSWQVLALPVIDNLHSADNFEQRWLVTGDNGALLWSLDGREWQRVITATDHRLSRPVFTQTGRVVTMAKDGLLIISDASWRQWQPLQLPVMADLHPPVETEQGLLVITGENGALLTSTNGEQWIDQSLAVNVDLNAPVFFGNIGLISGDEGALMLSTNGGRSWIPVYTNTPSDLKSAVQSPEGDLFIAGDDGTLLLSRDMGRTWHNLLTGIPTDLQPPVFQDDSLATLSSYGGLYQLADVSDLLDEDRLPRLVEQLQNSTQPTIANTLAQLEEQKELLEDYKTTLIEYDKSELNDQLEKSLVRISALAVIMFLVQILITNYRYSIKLSDYYLARAQGLAVVKELGPDRLSADDISSLLAVFTPATEFGKQIDTPIDKVMALAEKFKRG